MFDSVEIAKLPQERLEEEIGALAAHISAATCRWLLLIAELDRREGYLAWGCRTCSHWLSLRCGVAIRSGQEHVRVGRALGELQLVREAFSRGELSYSKVRALSRIATPALEGELLEIARNATGAQLDRLVRSYRGAESTIDANAAHERRFFGWDWEEDGSFSFRGRLSAEEGALFLAALEAAREGRSAESDGTADQDEPTPRRSVRNPDAVVAMAECAQAAASADSAGGERHQVVLHVDVEQFDWKRGRLDDGPSLAPETARRLACDASIVTSFESGGRALSVGRKTRSIPPAIRRALRARDGGCRFPGCTARRFVDAHHIEPWSTGGETSLSNLAEFCRHHHRLLHEGGFTVERIGPRRLRFRRPDGRIVPGRPRRVRGRPKAIAAEHRRNGLGVASDGCAAKFGGDPFEYDLAVGELLRRAAPPPRGSP
ncbi:MAG: DUF222 domain-containing protein [Solirubrobacterales bacterium]